jgi:hypothetical protein
MITVAAAALLAGTGLATAQNPSSSSSTPERSERAAPSGGSVNRSDDANRGTTGERGSMSGKSSQTEDRQSQGGKEHGSASQRAEDQKAGAKSERNAEDTHRSDRSKSMSSENERQNGSMKSDGRNGANMNAESREGRSGSMNAETRTNERSSATVGQAGAAAKLSTEQRTRITTVIRNERVQPLDHVNFQVSVGTRVPRDIRFHPLPQEVLTIYPEWRGYEFVLVNDQIVVIDPRTFEIVAILEA